MPKRDLTTNLKKKPAAKKRAPATVKVSNDAAANIVQAMAKGMNDVLTAVHAVMVENQKLLKLLTAQQQDQAAKLTDIHGRKPVAPVVKIPPRPRAFHVELEKDDDGETTGMRIEADRLN